MKSQPDLYSWLSTLRTGDPVVVVRFTDPPPFSPFGAPRQITVEEAKVEQVSVTHVRAQGRKYRRINMKTGGAGWAADGSRINSPAMLDYWRFQARQHAALLRLAPLDHAALRLLRDAIVNAPDGLDADPVTVEALEEMADLYDRLLERARGAYGELEARKDAWWASVREK